MEGVQTLLRIEAVVKVDLALLGLEQTPKTPEEMADHDIGLGFSQDGLDLTLVLDVLVVVVSVEIGTNKTPLLLLGRETIHLHFGR